LSGNSLSENTLSGNSLSENSISGNSLPLMTLEERRQLRTSMEETEEVSEADRKLLSERSVDFSGKKIACLGDSITEAANLDSEENYKQYAYPALLQELLGAEEVYNLGVGGSSIGRYWADAFVDRYQEIPEDVDIILVMGGTNDGFCVSEDEFGSLENRESGTFCGDLDELMRGLQEHYPDADIFFVTPLPNILQDYLMSERDYLLPQRQFVDVILTMAQEYGFPVIDLYDSNILDSHDVDIVTNYVPDGVHPNHEGYRILAEHLAAELTIYYERYVY
jgi:lysophospholipase L1-like esterase